MKTNKISFWWHRISTDWNSRNFFKICFWFSQMPNKGRLLHRLVRLFFSNVD
jgi:hypothetical protein